MYSHTHLTDRAVLRDLAAAISRDRATTATLLSLIAEVDARKLYLPAGYPSMYAYCMGELHLSEDTAWRRITAARAARTFPAIFASLAKGELHVSGVLLLEPHLTPENAQDLLTASVHKSKSEIEHLLAERFPKPDVPTLIRALPAPVRVTCVQVTEPREQA
ncbi:MAG TPA: hypothetical protein VFQ05_00745, partial [Candidatus Eisenbacteria bacterium]|nr:hypothetical protein [Candidatus Eisenbacteria bacterium]